MDTMKAQQLKSMNSGTTAQFLYNHILVHSVIALTLSTSLLCSLPSQSDFMKHFLFTSLPSFWFSFVNPNCLFIVVNVIIGLLIVGESKSSSPSYSSSSSSSSAGAGDQIYEEYIKRKMELNLIRENSVVVDNKSQQLAETNIVEAEDVEAEEIFEDVKEEEEEEEKGVVIVDDDEEKKIERDDNINEDDQNGLPAEELNRRIEAFIARVNKQRWLEAKSLVCCKA